MNSRAAQELLDLIMLDDYVARKRAVDVWAQRWIATMHVEGRVDRAPPNNAVGQQVWNELKGRLVHEIFAALMKDEVHAMNWGRLMELGGVPDDLTLACQMHVILQEPRDANAWTDAAGRMRDMAKGGGK